MLFNFHNQLLIHNLKTVNQSIDFRSSFSDEAPFTAPLKVEFGSKHQVGLVEGYMFIDKPSWDTFSEGGDLQNSIERYRKRMDYCPEEVLADKIYCTRANRKWLAEKNIRLSAQPLGRPGVGALSNPVGPVDQNRIEGKLAYGLDCINNPKEPKILYVGNNPDRQNIYSAALGLYNSRIVKLINKKGQFKSRLL